MTALVSVEAVALVLLGVLVAGLLRSHADILRALHRLGVDMSVVGSVDVPPQGTVAPARRSGGRAADGFDIAGVSPRGDALHVAVAGTQHDTMLAFLTSGCATCLSFWNDFATPDLALPGGARLVVVVHSPDEESVSRIRALAPTGVPVVMSSPAWEDYRVEVAPYFVYVSGPAGRVVGEGAAATWGEISSLLGQALDDRNVETRPIPPRPARRTDRVRESRADNDLLAAGITPGDPRLYPQRLDGPSKGEG